MTNLNTIDNLQHLTYSSDWLSVSYMLSLDVIVFLYKEMGLNLNSSMTFTDVFRDGVVKIKAQGEIDDLLIDSFKSRIRNTFSEQGLEYFLAWFNDIFRDCPENKFSTLWHFFELMSPQSYTDLQRHINLSDEKIGLLESLERYCFDWQENDIDETSVLLQKLRRQRLSNWDEWFCKANNLVVEDRSFSEKILDDRADLFQRPIKIISKNRLRKGWKNVWSQFSISEREGFLKFCNDLIRTKSDHLTSS